MTGQSFSNREEVSEANTLWLLQASLGRISIILHGEYVCFEINNYFLSEELILNARC
jgi:hypothetical protein